MYLMHFGEYLSEKNIISYSQLEDITYSQKENRLMLAQLAFSSGYLSKQNLVQLLSENNDSPFCFTKDCMSRGLITSQQAQQLLYLQSKNHNILCQTLSNQNVLSREDLCFHLEEFKNDILFRDDALINTLAIDDAPLMKLISMYLRNFFFNEGYATNIESVETELCCLSRNIDFATEIKLNNDSKFFLCLRLNEFIVSTIAASRQRSYSNISNRSQFFELFTEIMFCLTYRITSKLRKLGHKVKQGTAQAYLPEYKHCLVLKCNTIVDPIEIAVVA